MPKMLFYVNYYTWFALVKIL